MTASTGQMDRNNLDGTILGWDIWDRTLGAGPLGQDNWNRSVRKVGLTGKSQQSGQDSRVSSTTAGQPWQDSWDRMFERGKLGQDSRDRSDWTSQPDRSPWTGHRGHDGQDKTLFGKHIFSWIFQISQKFSRKCFWKKKLLWHVCNLICKTNIFTKIWNLQQQKFLETKFVQTFASFCLIFAFWENPFLCEL